MSINKKVIPFSPPDISEAEIQAVSEALRSGWITTGPRTKEFEKRIADYIGTPRAAALNSATAALETTLRLLGIGEGDEVITTVYTYTATASPICHVGATPILVDTIDGTYDMDYKAVEKEITPKTKAIIAVDIAGIPYPYYDELYSMANEKKSLFKPSDNKIQKALGRIAVLSDAAHAFGAWVKRNGKKVHVGQLADFTSFSFHAVKNLTTAEGGALTWSDKVIEAGITSEELYKECMLLSLHGQSKDALAKTTAGGWEYDVIGTYYKCNMTDIMAAIGLVQLDRYEGLLSKRRELIDTYDKCLKDKGIEVLTHYTEDYSSTGHLYLARLVGKKREGVNAVITKLAAEGISTNVHYKPLPMLTAYKKIGFDIKDFPNAYRQFENEITLPLHTKLDSDDVEYVCDELLKLI